MTTRILLFVISFSIYCGNIHAQRLFKKLLKKDKSEVVTDTIIINTPENVIHYPCNIIDEKLVVTNSTTFSSKSTEQIFINLLLYIIEQHDVGKECILHSDIEQKSVHIMTKIQSNIYSENHTYYKYTLTFKITNQDLYFSATEMYLCNNNLFGELKEIPFENLQPNSKAKHKNYINEFSAENSVYLYKLFQYIENKKPAPINHWEEIANHNIIKGMNTTECLLAVGKPMHTRQNGSQTKWMVNNDFVVIFENGIVTKVIN